MQRLPTAGNNGLEQDRSVSKNAASKPKYLLCCLSAAVRNGHNAALEELSKGCRLSPAWEIGSRFEAVNIAFSASRSDVENTSVFESVLRGFLIGVQMEYMHGDERTNPLFAPFLQTSNDGSFKDVAFRPEFGHNTAIRKV
jgi:hypothetical protein